MTALLPLHAWLQLPDGKEYILNRSPFTIGRSTDRDLVLDDTFVSGMHAIIERSPDGSLVFTDQRSRNGSFVNERRATSPVRLHDGMCLRMGNITAIFRSLDSRTPAGVAISPSTGSTDLQLYSGPCWLLLADLAGFTVMRQQLSTDEAEQRVHSWIEQIRRVVEACGGSLNSQAGDAILCYWRGETSLTPDLARQLQSGLLALQSRTDTTLPFRIVINYGHVTASTNATRSEHLSGSSVDFLFRIEKLSKALGTRFLLSAPAAAKQIFPQPLRNLGQHTVESFPGMHELYGADSTAD